MLLVFMLNIINIMNVGFQKIDCILYLYQSGVIVYGKYSKSYNNSWCGGGGGGGDGVAFRIAGSLLGESTGIRWIPLLKSPVIFTFVSCLLCF